MKVLIIGGTGKLGKELIKQSLEAGHEVTALVRNPAKISFVNPKLHVVKGDVLQSETMDPHFKGQDAVLCALGHKRFIIKTNILSKGTDNIIGSMRKQGVKRLICVTALGINDSRFKLGIYYTFFTIPFILFFYFRDKAKQEDIITNSGLDWTIVRPAQFIPGRKRGRYKTGPGVGHYILTKLISRADVAHFILHELKHNEYLNEKPGISY